MSTPRTRTIEHWMEREARLTKLLDRCITPTETKLVTEAIADVRAVIARRSQIHPETRRAVER